MLPGALVISGSISSTVPVVMIPRKLMIKMMAGFNRTRGNTDPSRINSATLELVITSETRLAPAIGHTATKAAPFL